LGESLSTRLELSVDARAFTGACVRRDLCEMGTRAKASGSVSNYRLTLGHSPEHVSGDLCEIGTRAKASVPVSNYRLTLGHSPEHVSGDLCEIGTRAKASVPVSYCCVTLGHSPDMCQAISGTVPDMLHARLYAPGSVPKRKQQTEG